MATHPTGPRPLGNRAMATVEDALVRLHTVRQLTERVDGAAERSNYPLVLALNARIRDEVAGISKSLGNAALGRY